MTRYKLAFVRGGESFLGGATYADPCWACDIALRLQADLLRAASSTTVSMVEWTSQPPPAQQAAGEGHPLMRRVV